MSKNFAASFISQFHKQYDYNPSNFEFYDMPPVYFTFSPRNGCIGLEAYSFRARLILHTKHAPARAYVPLNAPRGVILKQSSNSMDVSIDMNNLPQHAKDGDRYCIAIYASLSQTRRKHMHTKKKKNQTRYTDI